MKAHKRIINTFYLQRDHADCGVACLASIINYHGGEPNFNRLRHLSGTSTQGTSVLGLIQAAEQIGLDAEGLEAESVENLNELVDLAILHVTIESKFLHYFVFYGFDDDIAIVGDPAKGVLKLTKEQLGHLWQSKALVRLSPTERFKKKSNIAIAKWQWFLQLVKPDLGFLIVALILGCIISALGLSTAVFTQKLIDVILPKADTQKFILSSTLVFALLLFRSYLTFLRGMLILQQGYHFNNRLISNFFSHLLRLSKVFFDTRKIGDMIARMNDARRIQSVISTLSGNVIIDLLILIASVAFLSFYSLQVALVMIASIPLYGLLIWRFNPQIKNAQKEVMTRYASSESNYVDTINGIATIKTSNYEPFFEAVNSRVYNLFQESTFSLGKISARFGMITEVAGTLLMMLSITISTYMVYQKQMQVGELVAVISITGNIVPSLTRLVISFIQVQEAKVAFDRMFEFTSAEKEDAGRSTTDLHYEDISLELKSVSFRFPGRKLILKNVSLKITRGEMVALLGESGHGKSTLLQLIQKFYPPESGIITINNTNLSEISNTSWRNLLGSVPQEVKIFNGNLIFNITISDHPDEHKKAIAFCEEMGFGKFFSELPQSYQTLVGEEGVNLSGGQRQLVAMARALYRNPRVLLLDEATSAMDRTIENFIISLLLLLKSEMAILMVTHRVQIASKCDRIYLLEQGEVAQWGSPKELLRSTNFYSESVKELESVL